jgi:hypothetical protein
LVSAVGDVPAFVVLGVFSVPAVAGVRTAATVPDVNIPAVAGMLVDLTFAVVRGTKIMKG